MKNIHSFVLACASLAVVATSTAYAQNPANSLTFTLGGGSEFFSSSRQMQNTGIGFGAIGYNFTDHWGIEGLLGFLNTSFDHSAHDNRQISGTLFLVDGLYHFNPYRMVQPYILAGVGITGLNPNLHGANNEGNINAGVGAQFFVNHVVAFRVDARDVYTMVGGKNDGIVDAGVTFLLDLC